MLIVDKDDIVKRVELTLTPAEALIISAALGHYAADPEMNELNRTMARRIKDSMLAETRIE